jgi:SulP family sulfate permease
MVLLFAAPLAKYVPMAVLAAILIVVSYNMGEWGETAKVLKLTKSSIAVWFVTFALTVVADLTHAVEFGMILAALVFIRDVAETTTVSAVTKDYILRGQMHILQDKHIPDYVQVFRIHGPFLFGATDKLHVVSDHLDRLPQIVVLRLRNMTALDSTGLREFEELAKKLHQSGRDMILCGARPQPLNLIRQSGLAEHIGVENVCENINAALHRARQLHEGSEHHEAALANAPEQS